MNDTNFSLYSRRFLGDSGILQLMDDLGQAAKQEDVIMLGGGNPSHIPAVQQFFRDRFARILDSEYDFETLISNYSAPEGNGAFIDALASFLRQTYGWQVGPENIALTNGSQTAFFFLFNMFAGTFENGRQKKILLPLAPEYIGYEDAGIEQDIFVSHRPHIEHFEESLFKYRVDFDALHLSDDIGAICVSRPTNPTGNVLTESEITRLSQLAQEYDIPLIVDNAYGVPFPGIIFTEAVPSWAPHVVLCLSLSKIGLPGARTGIVIAHQRIIQAITGMNAVISLAPGSLGAYLAIDAVRTGEILRLSQEVVRPHYYHKSRQAVAWVREELAGVPFHIHKPEGAFFLWLWFPGLPLSSQSLYENLKARGVLVIPGHHFFPGITGDWRHKQECIRVSYAAEPNQVRRGIEIIAEEVKRAWRQA